MCAQEAICVPNFSETPCVKIGFDVRISFVWWMRAVFPKVGDSIFFCLPRLYFYLREQPFSHTRSRASAYKQLILAPERETLPWQSDKYARRIFQGIKFLILVFFFRVFWKVLCKNELMVFLGSAHFPYRVKMRSFQKFSSKICIF